MELQTVDTALRQLQHKRSNLPEQQALDEQESTRQAVGVEFSNYRNEMSSLQVIQARLENEIATVDSRRKSEEGRMYSGLITSEKEVEALRHELSALKTRKSDLEDQLLAGMERLEEVEGYVTTLKQRRGELDAAHPELVAARDTAAKDIDAELAETTQRRGALIGELPTDVLSSYDDLLRRKSGLAVAELSHGVCMGCRLELTASEMEEVKEDAKRSLAICPQCGRGLVPSTPGA